MFDSVINWTLSEKFHEFPGPEGGTCLNEAAIVAAGFKYRPVYTARDCPKSFSRVISKYVIGLNDRMPDDLRQELLRPFVTRLAGAADTKTVEEQRRRYIAIQTVNRIFPIACRKVLKREDVALSCEAAKTIDQARVASLLMRSAASARDFVCVRAAGAFKAPASGKSADLIAFSVCANDADFKRVYVLAVEILDGALRIGKQARLDIPMAAARLEAAKMKMRNGFELRKVAERYAWLYPSGADDLLSEALARALTGTRQCPTHVDVVKFLAEVICSVADGEANKIENQLDIIPVLQPGTVVNAAVDPVDSRMDAEESMIAAEDAEAFRQAMLGLFPEDQQARDLVDGIMEGYEGEELRALTDLDETSFASKRRLIRRTIDREYPQGWKQ